MDNKEAIAVLKSNYPHGRIMISEAVALSIKALEDAESQTTAVQQLKAEIRAISNIIEFSESGVITVDFAQLKRRLRELSAV